MSAFANTSNKSDKKGDKGERKSKKTPSHTAHAADTAQDTSTAHSAASQSQAEVARWGLNLQQTEEVEDWASEWAEVLKGNGVWGGRTRGGRGVGKMTGRARDISVEGVTLAFCGKELLQRTSLKFIHGRRYGILGENGVGKSTLLRRIARRTIPGLPLHFRMGYVQQELPLCEGEEKLTVLEYVMKGVRSSAQCMREQVESLREEEEEIDQRMENTTDTEELSSYAEQLCAIAEQIEELELKMAQRGGSDTHYDGKAAITRADLLALGDDVVNVLDGLGLSKPLSRLSHTLSQLSGGWRMRAALAQCLCNAKDLDLLLLDEPTNHLDLPTVAWLQSFLSSLPLIVVLISHDRSFLNAVCTDIVEMKDLTLTYFPSNYDDYLRNKEEMQARKQNALDARARKETHLQKAIDAAQSRGDDRLVKTKAKKLERAAFTRSLDGHKFKLFSLDKLDESYVRMPEIIEAERERYQSSRFKFPQCDALSTLRLASITAPLIRFENVSLSYTGREACVLQKVSFSLTLQSRVGIVGRNGKGKSSLLQAIAYAEGMGDVREIPGLQVVSGTIHRHRQLSVGVVAQHQIDALSAHLAHTPLSFCLSLCSSSTYKYTELEMRAHLGAFGLSGALALQPIGSLSGGQKARLSFAVVCLSRPHLLLLDEPSNHLSVDAIDALVCACKEFSGAIVVVSHNRHFLAEVCSELFVIDKKGSFSVRKPEWTAEEERRHNSESESADNSAFVGLLEKTITELI